MIQTIDGKIVLEQNLQFGTNRINTDHLSKGFYVVKLMRQKTQTKFMNL